MGANNYLRAFFKISSFVFNIRKKLIAARTKSTLQKWILSMCMCASQNADCSMAMRHFNGSCSGSGMMTLPISGWLFYLEDGAVPPCCALQFLHS